MKLLVILLITFLLILTIQGCGDIIMKNKVAQTWQKRAEHLFRVGYGDCDRISVKLVEEMKAQGLVIGVDFVVLRGRVGGIQHMCLEMYGKNSDPPTINGYRIDGTAKGSTMVVNFKGPYNI